MRYVPLFVFALCPPFRVYVPLFVLTNHRECGRVPFTRSFPDYPAYVLIQGFAARNPGRRCQAIRYVINREPKFTQGCLIVMQFHLLAVSEGDVKRPKPLVLGPCTRCRLGPAAQPTGNSIYI